MIGIVQSDADQLGHVRDWCAETRLAANFWQRLRLDAFQLGQAFRRDGCRVNVLDDGRQIADFALRINHSRFFFSCFPITHQFHLFSLFDPMNVRRLKVDDQAHAPRITPPALDGDATIHDYRLAGHEHRFIRGQEYRQFSEFFSFREASHGLSCNEILARLHWVFKGVDTIAQRGRVHRARAQGIATDTLLDIVNGDGFRQADYRSFRCAIYKTIGNTFD